MENSHSGTSPFIFLVSFGLPAGTFKTTGVLFLTNSSVRAFWFITKDSGETIIIQPSSVILGSSLPARE